MARSIPAKANPGAASGPDPANVPALRSCGMGLDRDQANHRKKREGVNPHSKKKMEIPAKKVPKFKAGKALKDLVS